MQIKDVDKLKAWLLSKLEPLCDADPVALAKYVVALLRKEKPKSALKDLCIDQLEVFLSKETALFVEKLFRCLETESYMKGEDPPKTPPIHLASSPSASCSVVIPARIVEKQMNDRVQSSASSKADGERRMSEDFRRKEVDDDDRDFRRSRRHEPEMTGGGRRIVAPIQVNYGGGGGGLLGKKRTLNPVQDGPPSIKRRTVIDHSRIEPELQHRSTSSGVSSTTATGGLRRSVRDRLGPRPDNSRSELNSSRRKRVGRSSSSSSSGSSSDSGSDSSTGSSEWSKSRKARKTTNTTTTTASASGGGGGGGRLETSEAGEDGGEVKKKQRCKDYDKKGFCILGESCPYDHGLDPLVIGGGMSAYSHPSAIPGIGVPTLHPPPGHEMLVPPMIPPNITGRLSPSSSKSDSYNPEEPGLSSSTSSGFIPIHIAMPPLPLRSMFPPPHPAHMSGMLHPHHHLPPFPPPPPHPHFVPPSNMIAPGGFHRPRHPFNAGGRGPSKPSDTLIVRKIPKELNTITKLSGHFEKFGTIVNLTVRYEGDLEGALVQFSSPPEAKKAHDNTEAVLNNRFIKVYYLRRDNSYCGPPIPKDILIEGPVAVAVSTIAVDHVSNSTPVRLPISTRGGRSGVFSAAVSSSEGHCPELPAPDSSASMGVAENAKRFSRTVLSGQDVRKVGDSPSDTAPKAMTSPLSSASSSLTSTTVSISSRPFALQQRSRSAEAAKKSLDLQKRTQELLKKQIDQQKELISKLERSGKSLSAEEKNVIMKSLRSLSTSNTKLKEAASKTVLTQRQEQQKANKEQTKQQLVEKQRNQLKLKAEALRKEAHKLGLISSPSQPLPSVGRGRGGHSVDARNNLHVKPRQLLVMGAKEKDQLVTYFESFGGLDSVEVDPNNTNNLIFTFRNSSSANQVVKTSTFKGKPLIMKWYQPKPLKLVTPTAAASGGADRVNSDVPPLVTPTLRKLDPQDLHLVEDSEDEEDKGEERAWRR